MTTTEKWQPIIEMVYNGNKLDELALYCEKHCNKENNILQSNSNTTLPIALKILSKLNLDNINFTCNNIPGKDYRVSITVSKEDIEVFKSNIGFDIAIKYESLLIEDIILHINSELEGKKSFNTNFLIKSIIVIHEGNFEPKLEICFSYTIK